MSDNNKLHVVVGNKFIFRYISLSILSIILGATGSCEARSLESPPESSPATPSFAKQTSQIRSTWEEREKRLERRIADYPANRLKLLLTILEQTPEEEIKAESERVFASTQAYAEMSHYDQTLIQALVWRAANETDRAGLVFMLARKAPRSIATIPLELSLCLRDPDNILIIFESYHEATDADNKKLLVRALRGGFKDQRERFENDEAFLQATKEWYLANRSKLKVNPYYYPFETTSSTKDLFVVRN